MTKDLYNEVVLSSAMSAERKKQFLKDINGAGFKNYAATIKERFEEIRKNVKEGSIDLNKVFIHREGTKAYDDNGIKKACFIKQFSTNSAQLEFKVYMVSTSRGWKIGMEKPRWREIRKYFGDISFENKNSYRN